MKSSVARGVVLKEGILTKQARVTKWNWKSRYMCLVEDEQTENIYIRYFESESSKIAKGEFLINASTFAEWRGGSDDTKHQFCITTTSDHGRRDYFHLRASSKDDGHGWIEAVNKKASVLAGSPERRSSLVAPLSPLADDKPLKTATPDNGESFVIHHPDLAGSRDLVSEGMRSSDTGRNLSGRSVYPGDKEGYLFIQEDAKNRHEGWVGKYFVLTRNSLRFYDGHDGDGQSSTGKAQGEYRVLTTTQVGEVSSEESLSPMNLNGEQIHETGDSSMEYQFRVMNVDKLSKIGGKSTQKQLLLCALSQFEMDSWMLELQRSIQWVKDAIIDKSRDDRTSTLKISDDMHDDESLVHRTDSLWRGSVEMDSVAKLAFSPRAQKEAEGELFVEKIKKPLSSYDWSSITGNVQIELVDGGADILKGEYLKVATLGGGKGAGVLTSDSTDFWHSGGAHLYHRRFCQLHEKTVNGISSCVLKIFKNHMQRIPIAIINLQRTIVIERSLNDSCTFTITHPFNFSLPTYNFQASSDTQRAFWEHEISECAKKERQKQFKKHEALMSHDSQQFNTIVLGGNRELPTVDVLSIKVLSAQNISSKFSHFNDFFATVRVGEHLVKTETVYDTDAPEWKNGSIELDILTKPDFVEVSLYAEPHHGQRPVYIGTQAFPSLLALGRRVMIRREQCFTS